MSSQKKENPNMGKESQRLSADERHILFRTMDEIENVVGRAGEKIYLQRRSSTLESKRNGRKQKKDDSLFCLIPMIYIFECKYGKNGIIRLGLGRG